MNIPNSVTNKIWEAVEEAIEHNVTPREFVASAWESWTEKHRDMAESASKFFRDMLQPRFGG